MPTEIIMPKWGMSMTEGTIVRWLKQPGDAVEQGEEVVEIESEKISSIVEAPASGTLAAVLVAEGDSALVQAVLAYIAAPGESLDALEPAPAGPPTRVDGEALKRPEWLSANPTEAGSPQTNGAPAAARAADGPVRATPVARRIARELAVDLATVQGSGPRGMIVEADVRKAAVSAKAAPAPAAVAKGTGPVRRVSFYSDGAKLAGVLYVPSGAADDPRPGVVLLVGYTYVKEMVVSEMARALSKAGFVALIFDYRGFGESEGQKGRLFPMEQVADAHAAVTFLSQLPEVDPERIALVGLSLGGSHAVSAAATDRRVGAAVAIESPADGQRWLRSLRRYSEWLDFAQQVAADRVQRTLSGQGVALDSLAILQPDPASAVFLEQVYAEFPEMRTELSLASADALIGYSPEALAPALGERPLLVIHGDADRLVPVSEAEQLYAAAPNSQLEIIPGMGHFDWVLPNHPTFRQIMATIAEWLDEQLST